MVAKYYMTLEEAYKKIEELERELELAEGRMRYYITFEALMNNKSSDQTVYIYTLDYENNRYEFTGVVFTPFENFYDNNDFHKYKDYYIDDMWARDKDEINVAICY